MTSNRASNTSSDVLYAVYVRHLYFLLQTIEMIEKEQREVERRPITKITHKGEIEIESQEPLKVTEPVEVRGEVLQQIYLWGKCWLLHTASQLFFFFFKIELPPVVTEVPAETPKSPEKKAELIKKEKDTTSQHKSHLFDLHCKICTGKMSQYVL